MSNLDNYSNIYADLTQGAYTGRPDNKSFADKSPKQKNELKNKDYATYNFGDKTKSV